MQILKIYFQDNFKIFANFFFNIWSLLLLFYYILSNPISFLFFYLYSILASLNLVPISLCTLPLSLYNNFANPQLHYSFGLQYRKRERGGEGSRRKILFTHFSIKLPHGSVMGGGGGNMVPAWFCFPSIYRKSSRTREERDNKRKINLCT